MDPDSEPPSPQPITQKPLRLLLPFLGVALAIWMVLGKRVLASAGLPGAGTQPETGSAGAWLALIIGWLGCAQFTTLNHALFWIDLDDLDPLERHAPRSAALLRQLRERLDRTWFTILVGNILFAVLMVFGLSALITAEITPAYHTSPITALIVFLSATAAILIGAEMLPGILVARWLERLAPLAAWATHLWSIVLAPLVLPPLLAVRQVGALRQLNLNERLATLEVEKRLLTLVSLGRVDIALDEEERDMIDHVLEFGQSTAGDLMTTRSEIVGFDQSSTHDEALEIMRKTPLSRLLVYQGSLDHVVGILHTKQILLTPHTDYHERLHPTLFVEEDMDLVDLLALMRHERTQLAVVLDGYGGTAGVVSFDDLLGAIVGQIPAQDQPGHTKPEAAK